MNIRNNEISQNDFTISFEKSEKFNVRAKEIYTTYGIVCIKNTLDAHIFKTVLETALYFYKQTSNKVGIKTQCTNDLIELDYYVKKLEDNDRVASLQAQKLISSSLGILQLSNNISIMDITSNLLNLEKNFLTLESFGGFVPSIPSNRSRLYTYHSEAHWLPLRKNFINCWLPLFRNKTQNNGTMFVKPFSHIDTHEFYEYQGHDSISSKDFYTQYEVPETGAYQEIALSTNVGDVVFFDRNLLHKSEINIGNEVGYLFINRFFDLSRDLTISANLGLRPYSEMANKIGRRIHLNEKD